jgi:hypothetical protein
MYEFRVYDWREQRYTCQNYYVRKECDDYVMLLAELLVKCSEHRITLFVEDLGDPEGEERIQVYDTSLGTV